MRIDLKNSERQRLFAVELDTRRPSVVRSPEGTTEIYLNWDQAIDDQGYLRRCPVCGCRELFVRKDFPQVTGMAIIVLAAVMTMVLFGFDQVIAGLVVLGAVALIDAVIYLFTNRCLVCYRCRSEFRKLPIRREHRGWNLSIGEKYRELPEQDPGNNLATPQARTDQRR